MLNANINSQEINFGDLTAPEQKDSTVTITNIGESTLEVSGVSIEGISSESFKSNGPTSFSLQPSESKDISIKCKPVKNGDLEATLKFTSNTAGETSEINLIGFSSGVVGVNELEVIPFAVESFPNPSFGNGMIKITSENSMYGTLNIVNLLGISVYSHDFSVGSNTPLLLRCDIPSEAAGGLYQAIITAGKYSLSIPITIVR